MKIKRIELADFRGFPSKYEFKIEGTARNLLVYGENGSGKSSLFHALKLFFNPPRTTDFKRTIKPIAEQANQFLSEAVPSVKIEFEGNAEPHLPYEWSADAFAADEPLIQNIAKTLGSLDYKALLETHYVHRHAAKVEIFNFLLATILLNVESPVTKKTLMSELTVLEQDKHGRMQGWRKDSYLQRIDEFNQGLESLLARLQVETNKLLLAFFEDTEISLTLDSKLIFTRNHQNKKHLAKPKVFLGLKLAGKDIRNGHTVLNEARLSAVAIALYLATLKLVPSSQLPLLVLDDLLIGIDMANRAAVMRVLLEGFKDWQIILLTHDRVWYETVKRNTDANPDWAYGKLLCKSGHEGQPFPVWKLQGESWKNDLSIASQHLENDDLRAAGVYTRAAFEEKISSFCAEKGIPVKFVLDSSELKSEDFWAALNNWIKNKGLSKVNDFSAVKAQVEIKRKLILNKLSHQTPMNLVKTEVQEAINVVQLLGTELTRLFPKV